MRRPYCCYRLNYYIWPRRYCWSFFICGVNVFVLFIFKLNDMYFVTFCDVLRNGVLLNGLWAYCIFNKKSFLTGIFGDGRTIRHCSATGYVKPLGYSQHSSIVASEFAPSHAMAFDLAIGQCKSFDYQAGKFWEGLLHRADWRDPQNGFKSAVDYYRTGKLNDETTKWFMNKPEDVLPKGEFGVENQFNNATSVKPSRDLATGNQEVANLQWDMPKPKSDSDLGIAKQKSWWES